MSAIDTAAIRASLERTGTLATRHDDDPGHIPDFWRKRIAQLLDAMEGGDVAAAVDPVDVDQAQVDALINSASLALHGDVPAKWTRGVWLIENAAPRMRTMNNEFSQRWLSMADAFLRGDAS